MDGMNNLEQFLHDRLDEDEALAQNNGQWSTSWQNFTMDGELRDDANAGTVAYIPHEATRMHIARHDPARVLRETEAKRHLLDLHGIVHRNIGWQDSDSEVEYGELPVCGHCVPRNAHYLAREDVPEGPCVTVRLLALPYADHLNYRDTWRP
ncbi:DUF6221 family protein [Streptomyces sp. NPDC000927]|uniref:DUF6221 family protein n=1 Tax=Streptomyces sp. NPDC000927 TaxID=3154371 RepID=UPI00331B9BE6